MDKPIAFGSPDAAHLSGSLINLADLIERFGEQELIEFSDREQHAELNLSAIKRAIDDAEAEVNSYVRAAKVLITKPSAALVGFACDVARYRLHDEAVSGIIEARYQRAIAWLKEAIKNPAMLDDALTSAEIVNKYTGCAVHANRPPDWKDYAA